MRRAKLFTGSSNPDLARRIADRLQMPLVPAVGEPFANGESQVLIDVSVRDEDAYVIQSGCGSSVNDSVIELCILLSACKLASARRVVAVLPCFPYGTQCKRKSRGCVATRLVANMLVGAGATHVITMDLHASQIQGFLAVPIDNLYANPSLTQYVSAHIPDYKNGVVVAKNPGAAKRVTNFADQLALDFALIQAESTSRNTPQPDGLARVVGEVRDRVAFVVDDIYRKLKPFAKAAKILMDNGVQRVILVVTHCFIEESDVIAIEQSPDIHQFIVTNTVAIPERARQSKKFTVIDVSATFAEVIRRTHNAESISALLYHTPDYLDDG